MRHDSTTQCKSQHTGVYPLPCLTVQRGCDSQQQQLPIPDVKILVIYSEMACRCLLYYVA
jgi:hypothetical protein